MKLHDFRYAKKVLEYLGSEYPLLLKATRKTDIVPLEDRVPELNRIAEKIDEISSVKNAVDSYAFLSFEFLKLQKQLIQTGRYLLSSEKEAIEQVYHNEEVFNKYYLEGLLLSQALWPNHFLINQFFREFFINKLKSKAKVVEVGIGCGYHLDELLEGTLDIDYIGFDISPYSIEFAKKYISKKNTIRVQFELANVVKGSLTEDYYADAVIAGEILEHIEQPDALLRILHRASKNHARMFITTVAYTANIDHIYLFERVSEIRELVVASGWKIEKDLALPVYSGDDPEGVKVPVNYAAVLNKH